MSQPLSDETKQRRADASRQNGRKSKGPVSPDGKYRSSMNAITTGLHVELHKEDLPSFYNLISSDNREEYLRGLQAHYRKFKPDSEVEQGYVRRMTSEMFSFDRNTSLYTRAMQEELDTVLREYPDIDVGTQFLNGHKRSITQRELFRTIERNKKAHLQAYEKLMKLLAQSRKLFPLQPPEPVDISADTNTLEEPGPTPEVVAELLGLADQAKKEPSFVPPAYVLNFLEDKEVMQRVAPNYDVADLLVRFGRIKPPIAA